MKIATNYTYSNFKGQLYYKGETIDIADAYCRGIATELEFDKIIKSPPESDDEILVDDGETTETTEDTKPEEILSMALCPYSDSALFLKLRQTSGIEGDTENKETGDTEDTKSKFTAPVIGRRIDIKA